MPLRRPVKQLGRVRALAAKIYGIVKLNGRTIRRYIANNIKSYTQSAVSLVLGLYIHIMGLSGNKDDFRGKGEFCNGDPCL